ncbi:MAG TPA: carboxylating nicotinate-nucleotide diphosphorylase [Chitinophagaceae bacterium]|jgi:nicotinate-nucleotide pyrophosphorylase (carboxylating)|nr:carboxylating nicotinate-nucleotide diphosphorylase [Chitinophagaceae bacterium]HAL95283.1 carboxylating nicotinate-nucleotide diphosphorylase [Chitinophagaceae bacterium]
MNQASLQQLIESALQEDIGEGDHSTLACISATARGKAVLKIKEAGIIAGIEVAKKIFQFKDPAVTFTAQLQDGDQMVAGEIAFEVESYVPTILQCERLVLNCMQRMSGIATLTHTYVQKLKGYSTKILDTRKTTPNFRLLEKEAVRIGGGINHRFGLYDMIMLKDNHIDFCGGIEKAIEKTWQYVQRVKPELKIEVEARSLEDVKKIISVGRGKVFRILLDNFTPQALAQAVSMLKMEGGFETEASGGINLENIESFAQSGVDYVSVGALIHQARSVDLSLKAVNF